MNAFLSVGRHTQLRKYKSVDIVAGVISILKFYRIIPRYLFRVARTFASILVQLSQLLE